MGDSPTPYNPFLPAQPGVESAVSNFRQTTVNRAHSEHNGWLWNDGMNDHAALSKSPNGRHKIEHNIQYPSTSSGLMEIMRNAMSCVSTIAIRKPVGRLHRQELEVMSGL